MSRLPFIDAKGDNWDIGIAIGRALRVQLEKLVAQTSSLYNTIASDINIDDLVQVLKVNIEAAFPQYMIELKGVASGSGLTIDELLRINFEELIWNAGCSTMAFACKEGIFLGHNEDWSPGNENRLYVIRARPKKGPSFLSLAYIRSLPGSSISVNSAGIAFSGNAILHGFNPLGVAKDIILRSEVEAITLNQFVKNACYSPRVIPNHTMAINDKGEIASCELTLSDETVFRTKGRYAHTNHVIHADIKEDKRDAETRDSIARLKVADGYLNKGNLSMKVLKRILRSHDNKTYTICRHVERNNIYLATTIASGIVNVKKRSLSVAMGTPCTSKYQTFTL